MKIYVCSSWRNDYYERVLDALDATGHTCWDWRNPPTGSSGFKWQYVGLEDYKHGDKLEPLAWREALDHPVAVQSLASDWAGMNWCDCGVLLHPCGRSAHLEAGWMAGRGKKVHLLVPEPCEPDLMIGILGGQFCTNIAQLIKWLAK